MNSNDSDKDKKIAALQAEIEMMQTIISMMPGHVYWRNEEGTYMGCNNNLANVLNLSSPNDFVGKSGVELIGIEHAQKTDLIDAEVLKSKKESRMEEEGFDAEGSPAYYLTQKSPIYSRQGELKGILGVSLDITLRKQMENKLKIAKEKAEATNRAKSQFLAMISHELRTPLTSILGFVHFLEQENLSESDKKKYIQYIIDSGSYLYSLINNLLDFNKLETNNYAIAHTPTDLKALMYEVINMLIGTINLKKLQLVLDYNDTVPRYFSTDSGILKQILINLVGNAIKFTEKGTITLKASTVKATTESTKLLIEVIDTGIGIPPEEQRSIFKRFYQSGNVYTRNASLTGTGLGLSIVKKLVALLGGKIKVTSIAGQGSTFYFNAKFLNSTPFKKGSELTADQTKQINTSSSKYNILLVEDDALIQIVHRQMLEGLNCNVTIAECATEALNMLTHEYDILFIDIGLPDIGGFDLIKTIRKNYFPHQHIPIIALTGYAENEERLKCLAAGADEVAIKPITKMELSEILKKHIRY